MALWHRSSLPLPVPAGSGDVAPLRGLALDARRTLGTWYRSLRLQRRCHVYCVGAAKTGTHSVAALFSAHYRSAHEPQMLDLIRAGPQFGDPIADCRGARRYLRDRDARLGLELEASHVLGFYAAPLVRAFADARFLITLHYRRLLASIPESRRLFMRTDRLAAELAPMAGFLGLPVTDFDASSAHQYAGARKQALLSQLDAGYVEALIERLCGPLQRELGLA